MINLLVGPPGGGKSYEAVVEHVLKAVMSGRLVVTNLPLNVDQFDAVCPGSASLVVVLEPTKAQPVRFADISDWGHTWRGEGGIGPLYVVDECHVPLPRARVGRAGTSLEVELWFSMHRHEGADVLLMTQSYGKVSADIIALVQVMYRVRKNVALGSNKSYTRTVMDGPRGGVVAKSVRRYKAQYFPLYRSHTRSNSAVAEAAASDVRPLWRHPALIAGVVMIAGGLFFALRNSPFSHHVKTPPVPPSSISAVQAAYLADKKAHKAPPKPKTPPIPDHPLKGFGVHIVGYLLPSPDQSYSSGELSGSSNASAHFAPVTVSVSKRGPVPVVPVYQFAVSQNGQIVFYESERQLQDAGYIVTPLSDCMVRLTWKKFSFYSVCDLPRLSVVPTTSSASSSGSHWGGIGTPVRSVN